MELLLYLICCSTSAAMMGSNDCMTLMLAYHFNYLGLIDVIVPILYHMLVSLLVGCWFYLFICTSATVSLLSYKGYSPSFVYSRNSLIDQHILIHLFTAITLCTS